MLTLAHFLTLGAILFAISVIGIFMNRKNLIVLLMAIELMLLAVNMNFIAFSHYLGDAQCKKILTNGKKVGSMLDRLLII